MSLSKKTIAAALALSLSPLMSPVAPRLLANANADSGDEAVIPLIVAVVFTLTALGGAGGCDAQQAQTLIDQAYAGAGEKLETLAGASGQSVEFVADTIIRLEKDGRISTNDPKAMAETLAAELSK